MVLAQIMLDHATYIEDMYMAWKSKNERCMRYVNGSQVLNTTQNHSLSQLSSSSLFPIHDSEENKLGETIVNCSLSILSAFKLGASRSLCIYVYVHTYICMYVRICNTFTSQIKAPNRSSYVCIYVCTWYTTVCCVIIYIGN